MEFVKGQNIILNGSWSSVMHIIHSLSVRFFHEKKNVLIIDTVNSLNPHHPVYNDAYQTQYFRNIYCVRTPLPYDLWARLSTASGFIKKKKIEVLLVTSLSLLFRDSNIHEVQPMIRNILQRIDFLTRKYGLITLIANSPSSDETAMRAFEILSHQNNVMEEVI